MKLIASCVAFGMMSATPALAEFCDYRPSEVAGKATATVAGMSAAAVAGAGSVGQYLGLYTITNATTGVPMLGAGTVGIMGGTAGVGATVIGAVSSPVVLVAAAGALVAGGAYEGGCWLAGQ